MRTYAPAHFLLLTAMLLGACGSDADAANPQEEVLAEQEGHVLRARHVGAALHIAEDFSLQQNNAGLDDFARSNVELGVLAEFQRDPGRTVSDLEAVWADLDEARRAELMGSRVPGDAMETAGLDLDGEEVPEPEGTGTSLDEQWLGLVEGKVLVYTNSTSAGYGDLSIANVLVERFTFHTDKRFEMTSGSVAAGAGIDQMAIDERLVGTWSLEALEANQAVVHVTVSGQTAPMALTLSGGQLHLLGKPVAVYAQ